MVIKALFMAKAEQWGNICNVSLPALTGAAAFFLPEFREQRL